jgi:hypothetical protein
LSSKSSSKISFSRYQPPIATQRRIAAFFALIFFIFPPVFLRISFNTSFELHLALASCTALLPKFTHFTATSRGAVSGFTINFPTSNADFPDSPCSPNIFTAAAASSHKNIVPSPASATLTHSTFPSL